MSTRKTYLVSVDDPGGPAVVEEIRTRRRVQADDLQAAAAQIEAWLRGGRAEARDPGAGEPGADL